jgi:hypothetical protein
MGMLEQLMNIIKEQGQQAVVNNAEVPNEHNEAVMQEAGSSIMGGLQSMLKGGNMAGITQMLLGGGSGDIVNQLTSGFAGTLAQKFGINTTSAGNIAGGLIPQVLNSLVHKAKDPNDSSIDLNSILGSLTEGGATSGGNIMSSIGGKLGLDKDGDGDVDLSDVTKMFGN